MIHTIHTFYQPCLSDITIPLDFETEAHRGFAFVEFEDIADAAAARDNMDEAELFGRTLKVNIARPIKVTIFNVICLRLN